MSRSRAGRLVAKWFRGWGQPPFRFRRRVVRMPVVVSISASASVLQLEVRRKRRLLNRSAPVLCGPIATAGDDWDMRRSFGEAFAWARSQGRLRAGSVTRWRLLEYNGKDRAGPATGPSAGGAMALALAYLHGLAHDGRRPYDRRTVLSASVAPDGTLGSVKEFPTKVGAVAGRNLTLLVSPDDLADARSEAEEQGLALQVEDVRDVGAALAKLRVHRSRHPYWIVPALVVPVVLVVAILAAVNAAATERSRDRRERVAIADQTLGTDPGGAIVAALSAHHLGPDEDDARNALLRVGALDPRLRGTLPGTQTAAIALSADGRRVAAAGEDHSVQVQEPGGGPYRTARAGGAGTAALVFAPDGRTLFSGDQDGDVVRWDVTGPVPRPARIGTADGAVRRLAISPDGGRLAVLAGDLDASVWPLAGPPAARPVPLPVTGATDVIFVDDDSVAVTTARGGHPAAAVYRLPPPAPETKAAPEKDLLPVNTTNFSGRHLNGGYSLAVARLADGRHVLVVGAAGGRLTVWDTAGWKVVRRVKRESAVIRLAAGRDGDRLVVGQGDTGRPEETETRLEVLELSTGDWLGPPLGEPAMRFRGRPQADATGGGVAALTGTRRVTLWSVRPEPALHDGPIADVVTDPDSPRQVITAGYTGLVHVVDVPSRRVVRTIDATRFAPIMSMGLAPDGRTLVTGHPAGRVVVWDRRTGTAVHTLTAIPPGTRPSPILSIAFDAAARRMATGSLEGTVRLWSLPDGRPVRDIEPSGTLAARALLFDEPRGRLIIGYDEGAAALVPLEGGRPTVVPLPAGLSVIRPLPGSALLTGDTAGELRVTDHRLRPMGGQPPLRHEGTVLGAAVSPDRRTWLTAGMDGTGHVVDARSRAGIAQVTTPESEQQPDGARGVPQALQAAAFTGDGRYAVFPSARGRIAVLDLSGRASIRRACSLMPPGTVGVPGPSIPVITDRERQEALAACR